MKVRIDHRRTVTAADRVAASLIAASLIAASLIAEGFKRLRAQQKDVLDGAKSKSCEADCAYSASVNVGNHESASQGLDTQ